MNRLTRLIRGIEVKNRYNSLQRDPSVWVFGEWFGDRCCDNSKYFANYVSLVHPEIEIVWITKRLTDTSSLNSRIHIVDMDSDKAMDILKRCGVAIISQNFYDLSSDGFNYVNGAISVHLWHGVPWKKIGHDGSRKKNLLLSAYIRIYDYVFGTDFYASPSDEYDKIACSAHGAKQNQIIHVGYARNSELYQPVKVAEGKMRILDELKKVDSEFDFSCVKIISYMPTFRNAPSNAYSFDLLRNNCRFMSFLDESNAIIVQKAHYVNQIRDGRTDAEGANRIYTLNNIAAQDLLCASDLLVTDYSGAFFDYLILDRPIVHYLYDYDYYRTQDRGLYYRKEDVIAGEEAVNEEQLVGAIIRNLNKPDLFKGRRHQIREIYMKYDTKDSCEILYQEIMKVLISRNSNCSC